MGWVWFLTGTALCSLGFFRPRLRTADLLRPAVIIPLMIWFSIFLPYVVGKDYDARLVHWREYAEVKAMAYVCLCVLGFWAGMWLPIGKYAANLFQGRPAAIAISPERFRIHAFLLCCVPMAVSLLWSGPGMFDARLGFGGLGGVMPGAVTRVVTILVDLCATIGALAIGFTWPGRSTRTAGKVLLHVVGLMCCLQVYMMGFSRGTGMTLVLAFIGYAMRFRRFSIWLAILLTAILFVTTYTSLVGREVYRDNYNVTGVYYHAGSIPYTTFFFTHALWAWPDVIQVSVHGLEQLTPVSVTVGGVEDHDINTLSKLNWLRHSLPLPRWSGLIPAWTADATIISGGARQYPFSYTMTAFGDTFAHWGWFGAVFFIPVGILFRFVDDLVIRIDPVGFMASQAYRVNLQEYYLSFYPLFMGITYGAFARGVFNNYRSLVVMATYALAFLILMIVGLKMFSSRTLTTSYSYQ